MQLLKKILIFFITGDDDFNDVIIEKPEIMTAAEFVSRFNIEKEVY